LGYVKRSVADEENPLVLSHAGTNKNVLSAASDTSRQFGYEGRTILGYFARSEKSKEPQEQPVINPQDTAITSGAEDTTQEKTTEEETILCDTLGFANGVPNFIRFGLGKGHLTLHAAPLVLSNYFLLQSNNYEYLSAIWQTLPDNINRVYWNDYYKRNADTSGLSVLWRYPATRLALLLAIFALLMYVLFESKRKQRIIPVIEPLKNDSVSFVETVGRLYYNKGNHANLAGKMTQQFLEWVRMHYFLNTNLLNEYFIEQLIIKSGQREAVVRELMQMIHEIKLGDAKIDDAYLYKLYNTIQDFYKNRHN
jgi:hypothetical protein